MEGLLVTGGERVAISCALPWVAERIVDGADGCLVPGPPDDPTLWVRVERTHEPFPTQGWTRLTRDASCHRGQVVIEDVATSGFDLHARCDGPVPEFVLRWRPPRRTRGASLLLRQRARLLARAVLLQYPVLWAASLRGRAPIHAPAVEAGAWGTALVTGASGTGKSTLVAEEIAAGGAATCDNLSVGDGRTVWGITEPLRVDAGTGRRAPHGRREMRLGGRAPALEPTVLVVLARGTERRLSDCDPESAARALTASTYAAGELRRYWPVHAVLASGTGLGPAHPPVSAVAAAFAGRLRAVHVELPAVRGVRLADVLSAQGAAAWT